MPADFSGEQRTDHASGIKFYLNNIDETCRIGDRRNNVTSGKRTIGIALREKVSGNQKTALRRRQTIDCEHVQSRSANRFDVGPMPWRHNCSGRPRRLFQNRCLRGSVDDWRRRRCVIGDDALGLRIVHTHAVRIRNTAAGFAAFQHIGGSKRSKEGAACQQNCETGNVVSHDGCPLG